MMRWLRPWTAPERNTSAARADHGSVAAGHDIRDSVIHVGLNEDKVGERIAAEIAPIKAGMAALSDRLAQDKGVPVAPLRAILAMLGKVGMPDHEIPKQLEIAIEQLIELRFHLAKSSIDRPEFVATRHQVLGLINRGDLIGARAVLQRARKEAHALQLIREEAEAIANEGLLDQLELRFRDAANKYSEAANFVAKFDVEGVWGLLMHQADALFAQGKQFGDNEALGDAIAIYRRCLTLAPRPKRPLDWATTQNSLGLALAKLGERDSSTENLKDSVAAFNEALKECTRARAPLDWSAINDHLGSAFAALGDREKDIGLLEAARTAYSNALLECPRDRFPLEWANTQSNLGTTLQIIGKLGQGTEHLKQSIECYHAALEERSRDRAPLDWALTQNNLGNTLSILGIREESMKRLQEAIAAFLEALKERTRERAPLDWAQTVSNLSGTLLTFALVENNPWRIASAVDGFRSALEVFEEHAPNRYIAKTREDLAAAERFLAERGGSQTLR
jgi:tetratricopeptide (TPR) repeat protein